MAARDRANGIDHREQGEAKGKGYAQEAKTQWVCGRIVIGKVGCQHGASATAKHKPEGANQLRQTFLGHRNTCCHCTVGMNPGKLLAGIGSVTGLSQNDYGIFNVLKAGSFPWRLLGRLGWRARKASQHSRNCQRDYPHQAVA